MVTRGLYRTKTDKTKHECRKHSDRGECTSMHTPIHVREDDQNVMPAVP
jgi:hypothetical protein